MLDILSLIKGKPGTLVYIAYIPPVVLLLFLIKIYIQMAVQADDSVFARFSQRLHLYPRKRLVTVKLYLAPGDCSALALPLQFNYIYIVVERQPLKNSAAIWIYLYERDSLSCFFQQNYFVDRLVHILHAACTSQMAPSSEDILIEDRYV